MASRKEEKERLRKERLAAETKARSSDRQRLILAYVGAGILVAIIATAAIIALVKSTGSEDTSDSPNVSTLYGVWDQDELDADDREGTEPPAVRNGDLTGAARVAGCTLDDDLEDEGSTHFSDLDKKVEYKTNPPTSGDHYASAENGSGALADGSYLETPNWNRAVHALEHGRVQIQYSPDLPEEDQLALKGVVEQDPAGVDLFPNDEMPYEVAVTGWTKLLGCDTYEGVKTLDAIRDARDAWRGQGPEKIPYSPFK